MNTLNPPPEHEAPSPPSAEHAASHAALADAEGAAAVDGSRASAPEPPLFARGNPPRLLRGGLTALAGALLAFLVVAQNGHLTLSVPLGLVCAAITAFGLMDLLGTFDGADEHVASTTTLRALAAPLGRAVATTVLFAGSLAGASSGLGSQTVWGLAITLLFALWVASLFSLGRRLGPWQEDELGIDRPLFRRHGFWLVVVAGALYLPTLGSFSLWDPWETHYGEVAREILARDDWISLWWAQDGWFWSKPILNFWMQALSMAALGVHFRPDTVLQGAGGALAYPEWAIRAPNVLLTIASMYLLYKGVAKVFGRRAGLLGGLVLATMPHWYFIAHQTMADMTLVAPLAAAMGLLIVGLHTDEHARVRTYEVSLGTKRIRLSGWHLIFAAVLLCAIPQLLYLVSRNIEFVIHGPGPHGLRLHWDEFRSGSPGNCGLPGNEGCNPASPALVPRSLTGDLSLAQGARRAVTAFEPFLQALLWASVLGLLLYVNWGERRVRRLCYLGAWFFAALATMGKGPVGIALPMLCAFAYVCTTKRWGELLRLEIASGVLIVLAVALPWYVAMYVRHGSQFTDRLIYHDMINRTFGHVHDTNEGDDTSFRFYIWQLGYALFPWTGLVPLGLVYWLRRPDAADAGKGDVSIFLAMWFLFAYALFAMMGTKFHHYIFPAIPPAAMLVGVAIDEMMGERTSPRAGYLVAIGCGVVLAVAGVAALLPGSMFGTTLRAMPAPPSFALGIGLLAAATGLLALAITRLGRGAFRQSAATDPDWATHERRMLGAAALAGSMMLVLVGRDLVIKPSAGDPPGAIRLLQLFTYNYRRPWPDSLDFSGILAAFSVVAVVVSTMMCVRALRAHAVAAFLALALAWSAWGLDVYMTKTAPHWGQRELIEAYYRHRSGPQELLVAYQMNWKGENFYTGNRIPAFVSTGNVFTSWLRRKRDEGAHVMYFITEHGRTGGLRSEVGARSIKEITDKALCNKFVLLRAEL